MLRRSVIQRTIHYDRLDLIVGRCRKDVQAFISSRLDYCNALLYGVSDKLYQRLESVQNAAARPTARRGRREHITSVLREMHWLPVRRQIEFKLTTLM